MSIAFKDDKKAEFQFLQFHIIPCSYITIRKHITILYIPIMFDQFLLELLVCPISKGPLHYDSEKNLLISSKAKVAYKIEMGIPILLVDEAISLLDDKIKISNSEESLLV